MALIWNVTLIAAKGQAAPVVLQVAYKTKLSLFRLEENYFQKLVEA